MKLKKEYLNIDIKEICLKNTNEMYNNNISEEWLNNFEKSIKATYYNNYIEIYIALYLIAEQCKKEKINLCIIGKWNGILDNNDAEIIGNRILSIICQEKIVKTQ